MEENVAGAVGGTPVITSVVLPATAANPASISSADCPTCGQPNSSPGAPVRPAASIQPVYAIGLLSPHFPSIGVEKEFAQLTAGAHQGDRIEVGLLQQVLADPGNVYLARHLCWVFATSGVDSFTVLPRDDAEIARLVEMLSPEGTEDLVHAVIGSTISSPAGSPCAASGLLAVRADQVLAFTPAEFATAMPEQQGASESEAAASAAAGSGDFRAVVREVFARLTRGAGNRGFADEHRARNYVALRYPPIYHAARQAQRDGKVLVGIDAQHSHSADRRLVSVRVTVRHARTDITEQYQCLVDVTEVFPFLITGLQPVYN
jgi:PatG C-terminal